MLLWTSPAPAVGQEGPESIDRAVIQAERIVRVRAVAESVLAIPRRSKKRPPEFRIDWRLVVMENWKGPMPQGRSLTLRVIGSRDEDSVHPALGEPRLTRQGEYLLFLRADSAADVWRPSSAAWGCMPIERGMIDWPKSGYSPRVTIQRLRRQVQLVVREIQPDADTSNARR